MQRFRLSTTIYLCTTFFSPNAAAAVHKSKIITVSTILFSPGPIDLLRENSLDSLPSEEVVAIPPPPPPEEDPSEPEEALEPRLLEFPAVRPPPPTTEASPEEEAEGEVISLSADLRLMLHVVEESRNFSRRERVLVKLSVALYSSG